MLYILYHNIVVPHQTYIYIYKMHIHDFLDTVLASLFPELHPLSLSVAPTAVPTCSYIFIIPIYVYIYIYMNCVTGYVVVFYDECTYNLCFHGVYIIYMLYVRTCWILSLSAFSSGIRTRIYIYTRLFATALAVR
jgi:hypothetical protein